MESGRVVWISVLEQNSSGQRPSPEEMEVWEEVMRHPKIPVLRGEEEQHVGTSIGLDAGPAALLLDAKTMRVLGGGMTYDAMETALEHL